MKVRYLRPCIQTVLEIITILLFIFFGSLDNFELSALPIIIFLLCLTLFNVYILKNYGRYNEFEEDVLE